MWRAAAQCCNWALLQWAVAVMYLRIEVARVTGMLVAVADSKTGKLGIWVGTRAIGVSLAWFVAVLAM